MKLLPDEFTRVPIVAWAIAQRKVAVTNVYPDKATGLKSSYKTGKTMIDSTGIVACPFDDYDGGEIDWDEDACHVQGMVPPVITIVPAQPHTFKICKEDETGTMIDFCYEIDGVFTDYRFNEQMQGAMEIS